MFGVRPAAKSRASVPMVSPVESVTVSRPSLRATAVAPVPRICLTPYRASVSAMRPATSPSMAGSRRSDLSINVAGMPSAVKIEANSTPTEPPPTITMSCGTFRME